MGAVSILALPKCAAPPTGPDSQTTLTSGDDSYLLFLLAIFLKSCEPTAIATATAIAIATAAATAAFRLLLLLLLVLLLGELQPAHTTPVLAAPHISGC